MRLAAKGSETYQGCGRKFTDHKQKNKLLVIAATQKTRVPKDLKMLLASAIK